ncbi:hypothetical protein GCM10023186_12960 [Hymenobacter koreensis]|uniref:Uncharacterized protein n=1 Tax=Hymenobacter koreensis TaxID=1084523 RepID=A0ABP8IWV0_9BACT
MPQEPTTSGKQGSAELPTPPPFSTNWHCGSTNAPGKGRNCPSLPTPGFRAYQKRVGWDFRGVLGSGGSFG